MARGTCDGCSERTSLTTGLVVLRDEPGVKPYVAHMCEACWEAIDGADPETGAYGAASVPVKRVTNDCRFCGKTFAVPAGEYVVAVLADHTDPVRAIDGCADCVGAAEPAHA